MLGDLELGLEVGRLGCLGRSGCLGRDLAWEKAVLGRRRGVWEVGCCKRCQGGKGLGEIRFGGVGIWRGKWGLVEGVGGGVGF